MTRPEQAAFVRELISRVQVELIRTLPAVPPEWDGHELRQWIADHFALVSYTLRGQRARFRAYRNTCRVRNLL